ncbi:MAG: hypothetical protein EPN22_10135 [Nitrospirae bacterium]|nr:MAG: hypothetical protein EPN22_10135 [Nitrospirota bacterium]
MSLTIFVSFVDIFCHSMQNSTMYLSYLFNYYRLGRFLFALALFLAFQVAGLASGMPLFMYALGLYTLIAFLRFMATAEKTGYFDFLLDIAFVSAIVYLSFGIYTYLSMLYLFPIFFSSILIRTKKIFIFPMFAALLYMIIYMISASTVDKEGALNLSLHLLSFSLIAFAGDNLKERMEKQERYIRLLEEEKIRMQGYERLYRVSADLAHELRNPLASISAAVQFLKEGKNTSDYTEMLDYETKRITNLVNDFLIFSRPSDAAKEKVSLTELLTTLAKNQRIDKKISLDIQKDISVTANRTFIESAINNILKNAFEAAQSTVSVSLKAGEHSELLDAIRDLYSERSLDRFGSWTMVEIEDDGEGIDNEMKDKIFEPFFTTKNQGTGLGLAISYRIINSIGGRIIVDRSAMGGLKFSIILPPE